MKSATHPYSSKEPSAAGNHGGWKAVQGNHASIQQYNQGSADRTI